jgi:hypothetical protein
MTREGRNGFLHDHPRTRIEGGYGGVDGREMLIQGDTLASELWAKYGESFREAIQIGRAWNWYLHQRGEKSRMWIAWNTTLEEKLHICKALPRMYTLKT